LPAVQQVIYPFLLPLFSYDFIGLPLDLILHKFFVEYICIILDVLLIFKKFDWFGLVNFYFCFLLLSILVIVLALKSKTLSKSLLVVVGFTPFRSSMREREVVDGDLQGITGEEEKPNLRMLPPGSLSLEMGMAKAVEIWILSTC
jgi:hypothetical protein